MTTIEGTPIEIAISGCISIIVRSIREDTVKKITFTLAEIDIFL